jgi:ribulose-5-phosphate 4-epimerase/fuculose-1-phosphate aldolase
VEKYEGVKFLYTPVSESFIPDQRLKNLNHWAFLFAQLGLTPVHQDGAYGNQSYRTGKFSFVITISGMIPVQTLVIDNFCHVKKFDTGNNVSLTEGKQSPSSESSLHNAIYQAYPDINTILHGHSSLLETHAAALNIPVTDSFYDYGTLELADSALRLMHTSTRFFILKNHGFVALGSDIDSTGILTLDYLKRLISILQTCSSKMVV